MSDPNSRLSLPIAGGAVAGWLICLLLSFALPFLFLLLAGMAVRNAVTESSRRAKAFTYSIALGCLARLLIVWLALFAVWSNAPCRRLAAKMAQSNYAVLFWGHEMGTLRGLIKADTEQYGPTQTGTDRHGPKWTDFNSSCLQYILSSIHPVPNPSCLKSILAKTQSSLSVPHPDNRPRDRTPLSSGRTRSDG
ncbi:MAG: hypothetical protein NTX50_28120 [Candidatus Sumerlaeota bacterium]|nr:hypothetical protein [Candidatus Sumerlaeota bacterium]